MITDESGYKYAYLACVGGRTQDDGSIPNHNKFYEMKQISASQWKATYGRVEGGRVQSRTYPMSKWNTKYREKTQKVRNGYIYRDITEYKVVPDSNGGSDGVSVISDVDVREMMKTLMGYANRTVQSSYSVVSGQVTQAQVDAAQALLNDLANQRTSTPRDLNQLLLDLYMTIPRAMDQVGNYLFAPQGEILFNQDQVDRLITREQDTLDAMAQQVRSNTRVSVSDGRSVLDQMNLKMRPVVAQEMDLIRSHMQGDRRKITRAFRVVNVDTQGRFEEGFAEFGENRMMLWHGSRNENWLPILDTGLLIRPTGVVLTGAMFGNGVYFADRFQKSYGYTSGRGSYWARGSNNKALLALFDVNLGNPLKIRRHEHWCYNLDRRTIRQRGNYHSIHALAGADLINPEFITYDVAQQTVAYLVEVSA